MRRFISLLLSLVMILGLLSGIAFAADPVQVTQDKASVVVYSKSAPNTKYYFATIDQPLIEWVCKNLTGNRIIKLLKDVDVTEVTTTATANCHLEIPASNAGWGSKDPGMLTFDLDGNTLSYTGTNNLFYVTRYGFTMKNGTVLYNGTAARAAIAISKSSGPTATSGSSAYKPVINLEGVTAINTGSKSGRVIVNYIFDTTINITNSTVWAVSYNAIELGATSQTGISSGWTPLSTDPASTVNVKNSTVGSGNGFAIAVKCTGVTVSLNNTAIVNNENTGKLYDETTDAVINTNNQEIVVDDEWFGTVADTQVQGKAHLCGDVSSNWEDGLSWSVNDQGTLSINGDGYMKDYKAESPAPWQNSASQVTLAKIGDSVTGIGNYAFSGCSNMTEVALISNITSIGKGAFAGCSRLAHVYFGGTEKQWNKISIDTGNEALTGATIHFEHPFRAKVNLTGGVTPQFPIDTAALTGTDNYAILTAGSKQQRIEQADWVKGPGSTRTVSYDGLAAKNLTETVTLGIYNASGTLLSQQSLSPYDALKARLDAATSPKNIAEYTAMLHYAAAAQKYFDHNTADLANKGLAAMADVSAYRKDESVVDGQNTGMIYGSSCILGTQLQLKFYFTENKTVLVNGKEVASQASPTAGYYYCLADVAPSDIFKTVTVEVKDGATTLATITDSVASYCARLYAKGGEKNKTLADALLNYGVAAKPVDTSAYANVTVSALTEKSLLKTYGRINETAAGLALHFAGSAVEFEAELTSDLTMRYNSDMDSYFTCFVDGVEISHTLAGSGSGKSIVLAEEIEAGPHTIRIVRESDAGKTGETVVLTGISFRGLKASVKAPAEKELLIEFVGDSITAGKYTQMNLSGEVAIHRGTNSYAYLTAKALDVDYSMVCRGGCGYFKISSCPKTMNQLYPYYNGFAASPVSYTPARQADVVVLALGANDSASIVKENYENGTVPFPNMEAAMTDLVNQVRAMHGEDVKIVFMYGMMTDAWKAEYQKVADTMGLYVFKTPLEQNGGNKHPSIEGHKTFATMLTAFLQDTVLK